MAHNFKINEEDSGIKNKKKITPTGIIGWLITKGIVRTPGQANTLLILFIVVGITAIIYMNLKTFGILS
jgi:hypothetical protein